MKDNDNILQNYIDHIYATTQHDNAGAIHPSTLGDCDRSAIYSYLGVEKDVGHSDWLKRVFFHGNRIEGWMNDALGCANLRIDNSIPVEARLDGIAIKGEIDHIIKWQGGWAIADTKSVSDHAFKYKSFPYEHHVLQVGAYQWMLNEMLTTTGYHAVLAAPPLEQLRSGAYGEQYPPVLFYVGRGNLQEKIVTAGDNAVHLALEKIHTLIKYISNEDIPGRPFKTPNDHAFLCANCVSKGSKKKKDGTRTTPSVYVPSCSYFKRCWGVLPEEWSFWQEVSG